MAEDPRERYIGLVLRNQEGLLMLIASRATHPDRMWVLWIYPNKKTVIKTSQIRELRTIDSWASRLTSVTIVYDPRQNAHDG